MLSSIPGPAPGDGTCIRGGPHGDAAWPWFRRPGVRLDDGATGPINLDYMIVNDVTWVDECNVIVSALGGGMGMFAAESGEMRHRFRIQHGNEPKGFTAGAMCCSDVNDRVFSSCKGRTNEYGVGSLG